MARSLIASDTFNRASPIGANWTQIGDSTMDIEASTMFRASHFSSAMGSTHGAAVWAGAETFSNDQYAKCSVQTLTNQGSGAGSGIILRCSGQASPGGDYYYVFVAADAGDGGTHTINVGKMLNDADTGITTRSSVFSNGDTISGEIEGTTIRVYRNDIQLGADITDASLSTGKPGICSLTNSGAGNYGDNWEGGDITAATGTSPKSGKLLNGILTQGSLVR